MSKHRAKDTTAVKEFSLRFLGGPRATVNYSFTLNWPAAVILSRFPP